MTPQATASKPSPNTRRKQIERAEGVTSFNLSKQVSQISGMKPTRKTVLRALADRYPNIWPSIRTISDNTGLGTTAVRESLRDLEEAKIISARGKKKGGRGFSEQYVIDVARIHQIAETQRIPLPLQKKRNAKRCLNPTLDVAFVKLTQRLASEKATPDVAEQRIEQIRSINREERTEKDNLPSRSQLHNQTLGQDEIDFNAVVEMSVEDEARIIESLPADLIRWTERPPLGTPLVIGENYHEADASFARDVVDELLAFGNIARDRAPFAPVVDYDDIWDLDIGFGVGTAIELAEEVVRHCPKHRGWIYRHLARQMTRRVLVSTENGQDYRTENRITPVTDSGLCTESV